MQVDRAEVVRIAQALIAVASPNPPLATGAVAREAAAVIGAAAPAAEVSLHEAGEGVVNVVARLAGAAPGRRVVLSGHLDTYPVNEALPWSVDPLGGAVRDGRLYGRGAADMKGGIAASIAALAWLAGCREAWRGEVVLALAGDEESMGRLGTAWLIETRPELQADGVIVGDAGSPLVARFGEKGFLWLEVTAEGRPAHGAHVHLGVNAIDRLLRAIAALGGLAGLAVDAPAAVTRAIAAARPVSEALSGAGEAATLGRVTVNVGRIEGGTSMNLIPASASALVDVRLPVGVALAAAEAAVAAALGGIEGVAWRVLRRSAPNHTAPDAAIVGAVLAAGETVLGRAPVCNMRVGASDARLFRAAGMPTVVYGPTPFNMGGADEYVLVAELETVARVHALAALRVLSASS